MCGHPKVAIMAGQYARNENGETIKSPLVEHGLAGLLSLAIGDGMLYKELPRKSTSLPQKSLNVCCHRHCG